MANEGGMPLTTEKLQAFETEGFAVGARLLDDSQLARLKGEFDAMIANLPPGQRPENMPSVHYDNAYLRELFLSDALVDVAAQILGPDIALFVTYAISKRPSDGLAVRFHQDAAYWPISPMKTFTLWLAVDDSDRENGCMRVIPGSHKDRAVREHEVDSSGRTTLPLGLNGVDDRAAVDVEVEAGAFSSTTRSSFMAQTPTARRAGVAPSRSNTFRPMSPSTATTSRQPNSTGTVYGSTTRAARAALTPTGTNTAHFRRRNEWRRDRERRVREMFWSRLRTSESRWRRTRRRPMPA